MRLARALICALLFCFGLRASAEEYVVQKGDCLYRIWQKTGSTLAWPVWLQNVADWNGLEGEYIIYPDQQLALPDESAGAPAPAEASAEPIALAEVSDDDLIEEIARRSEESVEYIRLAITPAVEEVTAGADQEQVVQTMPATPVILPVIVLAQAAKEVPAPAPVETPTINLQKQEPLQMAMPPQRTEWSLWWYHNWPMVVFVLCLLPVLAIAIWINIPDWQCWWREQKEAQRRRQKERETKTPLEAGTVVVGQKSKKEPRRRPVGKYRHPVTSRLAGRWEPPKAQPANVTTLGHKEEDAARAAKAARA